VREVRVRLADPSVVIVRGRDEVPVDPGVQLGVGSPNSVHPDHIRMVLFAAALDTERRERADKKHDREEDDSKRVEATVEVRCLPNECEAHDAGRNESQEDRDPHQQLVVRRAPRREQAVMLRSEQLRSNRWWDLVWRL
jgi:hypothetical protein